MSTAVEEPVSDDLELVEGVLLVLVLVSLFSRALALSCGGHEGGERYSVNRGKKGTGREGGGDTFMHEDRQQYDQAMLLLLPGPRE